MSYSYLPRHRGFTLTEGAIFLGIIGLIMAAIWVAASTVHERSVTNDVISQTVQMVQNMRSLYKTKGAFSGTSGFALGSDITGYMRSAHIFPEDMLKDKDDVQPTSPWGTDVNIFVDATSLENFQIHFQPTLRKDRCITLASQFIGDARDPGLQEIIIDATSYADSALDMLSPTDIAQLNSCASIILVYSLRG